MSGPTRTSVRTAIERRAPHVPDETICEVSGFRFDNTAGGHAVLIDVPKTPDGRVPGRLVFAPHEARALIAAIEAACLIAEGA